MELLIMHASDNNRIVQTTGTSVKVPFIFFIAMFL